MAYPIEILPDECPTCLLNVETDTGLCIGCLCTSEYCYCKELAITNLRWRERYTNLLAVKNITLIMRE